MYGVLASFYGLWGVFRADFESESVMVSSVSDSQPREVPLLKAVFAPLVIVEIKATKGKKLRTIENR